MVDVHKFVSYVRIGGQFLPSGATCKVSRKRPAEDSQIKGGLIIVFCLLFRVLGVHHSVFNGCENCFVSFPGKQGGCGRGCSR